MYSLRCTTANGAHSLSRVWLSPEECEALKVAVTTLHPALDRSSQWDRVEVSHSRDGVVAVWTPEQGWF